MGAHTPDPCRYRPRDEALRLTFAWFMQHGETRHAGQGSMSNAYCAARNTGQVPAWCQAGTAPYAAAKAGLCRAKKATEA